MKPLLISLLAFPLAAQDLRDIVNRIERLERENQSLREEVRVLKERVAPAEILRTEERLDVVERRVEEQAQTKVEASQKFPVRLRGMAIVNAFANSKLNGGNDNPALASLNRGGATGGATWRQSVIGLEYDGGASALGGTIRGSVFFDFFGGANAPLGSALRIRTASLGIDWATRSFTVGQDKPIISPRDPDSLSQIGVSPLTGAGNLWLWLPQVKFEQRIRLSESTRFAAQLGIIQTNESATNVPPAFAASLERYRPGYEGRFELSRAIGGGRIEVAPGFHHSSTHVAAGAAGSNVFSLDWRLATAERIALTGAFFRGTNVAHFGTGGIRQGFIVVGSGDVRPVHSQGGWTQIKLQATSRLRFHLMTGVHDDRNTDLRGAGVGSNRAWGGNFFYNLSPNLIVSLEGLQTRTNYLGIGMRRNNHYDLSLAYLF